MSITTKNYLSRLAHSGVFLLASVAGPIAEAGVITNTPTQSQTFCLRCANPLTVDTPGPRTASDSLELLFNQFDASLGTLRGITISIDARLYYRLTSIDDLLGGETVTGDFDVSFKFVDDVFSGSEGLTIGSLLVSEFLDDNGSNKSGSSPFMKTLSKSSPSTNLSALIGNGTFRTNIGLDMKLTSDPDNITLTGTAYLGGPLDTQNRVQDGVVNLFYTYETRDPGTVPEPGTLLLSGLGLVLAACYRQQKG